MRDLPLYVAYVGDNTPPYLYAIANDYTDPPSALAFLADVEVERVERLAEMWADARAMGIA